MTTKRTGTPVRFRPTIGEVYENVAGGEYRCQSVREPGLEAWMQNTVTGWTLLAHGIVLYEDGKIEWNYSTGGHFEEQPQRKAELRSRQISLINAMLCMI